MPGRSIIKQEHTFIPLHMCSVWQEPGTTLQRITVAIILPSGVGAEEFKVRVIEDGDVLELTVRDGRSLSLISSSCTKNGWIEGGSSFTDFHPKFLGFEATLRRMRENLSSEVSSVARIGLPFTVQSHIDDVQPIGWIGHHDRMIYVDLKAVADDYSTVKNTTSFELV